MISATLLSIDLDTNGLDRVHAMYFTDKICSQPLTPAFHFSDLRSSVPGYTELVARTLKATVLTVGKIISLYKLELSCVDDTTSVASVERDPEIHAGIPYMLRGRCLCFGCLTYHKFGSFQ